MYERFVTTAEAARLIGVSRRTLLRALHRGEISGTQTTPGGPYCFQLADLEAYAARRRGVGADCADTIRKQQMSRRLAKATRGLRQTYDALACGVVVWTAAHGVIDANATALRLLGLDLTAMSDPAVLRELLGEPDTASLVTDVQPGRAALSMEKRGRLRRFTRPDGTVRTLLVDTVPLHIPGGAIAQLIISFVDVSERQEAEATWQAREERYRRIVETAQEGIWEIDSLSCTTFVNETMARMLGYTVPEMLAQPIIPFVAEADRPTMLERLARRRHGQPERFRVRLRHKEGHDLTVSMAVTPQVDADGAYSGVLAMVTDVTDQVRAEETLQWNEARYRALSEQATDIVGILDADGRIGYVSPSVERLLGYTPAEVCGQNGFTFLHPDDVPHMERVVARLLEAPGTVVQAVARFRHRDGSWRTFEVINRNQLHDPAIRGIIFNERDITERVEAEAALRASEERFRALSEHATDLVAVLGAEGTYCYLSPSWQRILGYAPADLLGRDGFALVHPEDRAGLQATLVPLLQETGALATAVFRVQHTHGGWRVIEAIATNRTDDSTVQGLLINARDITERVRVEEALRHQAQHDNLTSLPNRILLFERMAEAVAAAQRVGGQRRSSCSI